MFPWNLIPTETVIFGVLFLVINFTKDLVMEKYVSMEFDSD